MILIEFGERFGSITKPNWRALWRCCLELKPNLEAGKENFKIP